MWTALLLNSAGPLRTRPLRRKLIDAWQGSMRHLLDPYRPELHYMRGPGPKWLEKHGMQAVPARARGR
jgi:hypothetical protein